MREKKNRGGFVAGVRGFVAGWVCRGGTFVRDGFVGVPFRTLLDTLLMIVKKKEKLRKTRIQA